MTPSNYRRGDDGDDGTRGIHAHVHADDDDHAHAQVHVHAHVHAHAHGDDHAHVHAHADARDDVDNSYSQFFVKFLVSCFHDAKVKDSFRNSVAKFCYEL